MTTATRDRGGAPPEAVDRAIELASAMVAAVEQVLLGHPRQVRLAVAALLARAHLLVEDAPGTGKTLLARSLATVVGGDHARVQATPDLLPADVTGTSVFQPGSGDWHFRPGPVFTNVLLVDEVNRASPRTQAALLEPMEERQATVDGTTHPLPDPFLLVATQNPFGDAGTFPLPASQLDRFGFVLELGTPDRASRREVLAGRGGLPHLARLRPVVDVAGFQALATVVAMQHVAESVTDFTLDVGDAVGRAPGVLAPPSTRALLGLLRLARAWALLEGRGYVTPGDVRAVAPHALGHRLVPDGLPDLAAGRSLVGQVVATLPAAGPG
jgi:MoxR-like ATPase